MGTIWADQRDHGCLLLLGGTLTTFFVQHRTCGNLETLPMKSVVSMFAWMTVSLLLQLGHAYPNGAGSCDGDGPAFSTAGSVSHRSEAAGKVVTQEPSSTFELIIDGEALVAGQRRELDINETWFWQLKALTSEGFKGFLVRFETGSGFAEVRDFFVDCESEDEDSMKETSVGLCSNSYITGCTHKTNVNKQQVTGTVEFNKAFENVKIDVTVVYENKSYLSRYAYQSFELSFIGQPTSAPSEQPIQPTLAPSKQPIASEEEPPNRPSPNPVNCFSGRNTVHEQKKGTIPISDLRVGDLVRTKGGKYSRVYSLGHWDPVLDAEFLQIVLSDGDRLELSDDHMVFVNGVFTAAKKVKPGDTLTGEFGESKQVTLISRTRNYGVYAPITEAGHLLVSGVLSSSYIDIIELGHGHEIAHWILAPVRLYCGVFACRDETHTHGISNLIHPIVDLSLRIKTLYTPVQYLVISVGGTLLAPANALSW